MVDPLLKAWAQTPAKDFPNYAAGAAGPEAADELLATRRAGLAADPVRRAMATASNSSQIWIAPDVETLANHYAQWLAGEIATAKAPFRLALCGGTTPAPLYRLLASGEYRGRIDWEKLDFYWGDERFVPHDDEASNLRLARDLWLDHVPLAPAQIHPMPTEGALDDCAARYEALLKREYGRDRLDPARPLFDVMLLGVGADGHTASLMPGEPVLEESERWVAAVPHGRPEPRMTLTYPAIASSRFVPFW